MSEVPEMVERVARALCSMRHDPNGTAPTVVQIETSEGILYSPTGPRRPNWLGYVDDARVAIAAMREPTEAMLAAPPYPALDQGVAYGDVWRDMIDEALR